jgi:hypothetical protein
MSKDLFFKMTEQEYFQVPQEIRERHFSSKNINKETFEFSELMKNETYKKLYDLQKKATKNLSDLKQRLIKI